MIISRHKIRMAKLQMWLKKCLNRRDHYIGLFFFFFFCYEECPHLTIFIRITCGEHFSSILREMKIKEWKKFSSVFFLSLNIMFMTTIPYSDQEPLLNPISLIIYHYNERWLNLIVEVYILILYVINCNYNLSCSPLQSFPPGQLPKMRQESK